MLAEVGQAAVAGGGGEQVGQRVGLAHHLLEVFGTLAVVFEDRAAAIRLGGQDSDDARDGGESELAGTGQAAVPGDQFPVIPRPVPMHDERDEDSVVADAIDQPGGFLVGIAVNCGAEGVCANRAGWRSGESARRVRRWTHETKPAPGPRLAGESGIRSEEWSG